MSEKKATVIDALSVYFSSIFSFVFSFVRGIIVARFLGPTNFGFWKAVELIQQYHQFSTLGTQNGMSRDIPLYIGKGEEKKAEQIKNLAFSQMFTLPLLVSLGIFIYSFFAHDTLLAFALRISSMTVFVGMIYALLFRVLESYKRFVLVSILTITGSIIFFVIDIILVIKFQIYGHLWALLCFQVIMVCLTLFFSKLRFHWEYSLKQIWGLIKVGFPIMLVGFAFLILTTVDRVLILKFLDLTQLGYYGLGLMVVGFMQMIPSSIGNVIYPRLNEQYGKHNSFESLERHALQPQLLLSIIMAVMLGGGLMFLGDIVKLILPQYQNGVSSALILMIGVCVMTANIFNTINRQFIYLSIQVLAITINLLVSWLLILMGWGIVGVAIGTAVAFITYKVINAGFTLWYLKKSFSGSLFYLYQIYFPLIYVVIMVVGFYNLLLPQLVFLTLGSQIASKLLFFSLIISPLVVVFIKRAEQIGLNLIVMFRKNGKGA